MIQSYLLVKAKFAIKRDDRSSACRHLHRHISRYPGDYEGWLLLGGLLRPEDGYKYIQKAQLLAPENEAVIDAVNWIENKIPNPKPIHTKQDAAKIPAKNHQPEPVEQISSPYLIWASRGILLLFLFLLAALFTVGLLSFIQGTEPTILGRKLIIVTSGSMEPVFETGSIILINTRANNNFQEGDIIMYRSPENPHTNITHRIIDVMDEEGVTSYRTKGDNNTYEDPLLISNQHIVGEYTNITIPRLGYFFSFIRTRNGIITLAMLFGFYLVISQAFKIKEYLLESEPEQKPVASINAENEA